MKKRKIGSFQLGDKYVDLYLGDELGASFVYRPSLGRVPEITIGIADNWHDMMRRLLHETFEFAFDDVRARYYPSSDWGSDVSNYVFVFDHHTFSDACGRVAMLLKDCLPVLAVEWKKAVKEREAKEKSRKGKK